MADIVDSDTRSRMMAAIRCRDTKPEMLVRRQLHAMGFRYRLHVCGLAGRPDIVLPRYGAVVFINGCFWHAHVRCKLFKIPATKTDFWREKLDANQRRDIENILKLQREGWRVATVWECALKGDNLAVMKLGDWLKSSDSVIDIRVPDRGRKSRMA